MADRLRKIGQGLRPDKSAGLPQVADTSQPTSRYFPIFEGSKHSGDSEEGGLSADHIGRRSIGKSLEFSIKRSVAFISRTPAKTAAVFALGTYIFVHVLDLRLPALMECLVILIPAALYLAFYLLARVK